MEPFTGLQLLLKKIFVKKKFAENANARLALFH